MNNKKGLPAIVIFAILTTITTFVWIGFEVYRVYTSDPIPPVSEGVLRALDPSLDLDTLLSVTQRVYLEDEEIGSTELINLTVEATPTPDTVEGPTELPEEKSVPTSTPIEETLQTEEI